MENETSEDKRFRASIGIVIIFVLYEAMLFLVEFPEANRDLLTTAGGVLLGLVISSSKNLIGDAEEERRKLLAAADMEKQKLVDDIAALKLEVLGMHKQYAELKVNYDSMMAMLINRHTVPEEKLNV